MSSREESAGEYWSDRLGQGDGGAIESVGDISLGRVYNEWLYRGMRAGLSRALKSCRVRIRGDSVFDAGVGIGAWIQFWERLGAAQISGLDIAGPAVDRLRRLHPAKTFVQADLGGSDVSWVEAMGGGRFNAVSALNVLYHLTSDEAFANGIRNAASLVRPGGWLIVTDGMGAEAVRTSDRECHRPLADYVAELSKLGFEKPLVRPLVLSLAGPISATTPTERSLARLHRLAARFAGRVARRPGFEWANNLVAAPLYLLDLALVRVLPRGPSLQILIARKEGE